MTRIPTVLPGPNDSRFGDVREEIGASQFPEWLKHNFPDTYKEMYGESKELLVEEERSKEAA